MPRLGLEPGSFSNGETAFSETGDAESDVTAARDDSGDAALGRLIELWPSLDPAIRHDIVDRVEQAVCRTVPGSL